MKKKLEGKIALVTGGTRGIGLATAKLFHGEGAHVIVTGKNRATLEVARASLRGIAEVVSSDSGDAAEIEVLFARVAKEHGGPRLALESGVGEPWERQLGSEAGTRRMWATCGARSTRQGAAPWGAALP